jgi:hypothetical protein
MLPAVENATHYDLFVDSQYEVTLEADDYDSEHDGYVTEICRPYYYTDIAYSYTAGNEHGESEMSPTLTLQWVWDFDYDDDGVVGWSDYGVFAQDFGTYNERSNADGLRAVGYSDFGLFVPRFGECNSGVKVVPCG